MNDQEWEELFDRYITEAINDEQEHIKSHELPTAIKIRSLVSDSATQAADNKAEGEPVGEVILFGGDSDLKEVAWRKGKLPDVGTKLYATPPATTGASTVLTDERIDAILASVGPTAGTYSDSRELSMDKLRKFAREVAAQAGQLEKFTIPHVSSRGEVFVLLSDVHTQAGQVAVLEWQPIETAPRDGSLILLGRAEDEVEDRNGESVPGRWHEEDHDGPDNMGHDAGFMDDRYDGTFFCGRSFGNPAYQNKGYQPTHWMPLPAAPSPAKESK